MSEALKEEVWGIIRNLAAGEEHAIEASSKTNDEELKKDLAYVADKMREIRQKITIAAKDIIFEGEE
ncbi:MAG: hypothetical protein ACTSX6_00325 [Candidatus Heimdallarchaeaceae archaeon]